MIKDILITSVITLAVAPVANFLTSGKMVSHGDIIRSLVTPTPNGNEEQQEEKGSFSLSPLPQQESPPEPTPNETEEESSIDYEKWAKEEQEKQAKRKQQKKAELDQLLALTDYDPNQAANPDTNLKIAKLYFVLGQRENARSYGKKAKELYSKNGNDQGVKEVETFFSEIDFIDSLLND